jgi:hypothetical protein
MMLSMAIDRVQQGSCAKYRNLKNEWAVDDSTEAWPKLYETVSVTRNFDSAFGPYPDPRFGPNSDPGVCVSHLMDS